MTITVKLFATLRMHGEKEQMVATETSLTPSDIIDRLRLPRNEVAIVMINGRHALIDAVLNDGDVLSLFPAVGGG
jgi:molybdopterin converting factor small subunit